MKVENGLQLALRKAGISYAELRRNDGAIVTWSHGRISAKEVSTRREMDVRSTRGRVAADDEFLCVPEQVPLSKCSSALPWTKRSIYSFRHQESKDWIVKVDRHGEKLTRIHLVVEPMLRAAFERDPCKARMTIKRIFKEYGLADLDPERYLQYVLRRSGWW